MTTTPLTKDTIMGITTLDLTARIAAKKAVTNVKQKLNEKRQAITAQRDALKAELKTTAPAQ